MIDIHKTPVKDGMLCSKEDLEATVDLFLRHLKSDPLYIRLPNHSPQSITKWFARKRLDSFWIARDENRNTVGVIGISRVNFNYVKCSPLPTVEICRLMVDPNVRGIGLASRLVKQALDAVGDDIAWLSVLSESKAATMYRRWGWREICRIPSVDDPEEDIVAMVECDVRIQES